MKFTYVTKNLKLDQEFVFLFTNQQNPSNDLNLAKKIETQISICSQNNNENYDKVQEDLKSKVKELEIENYELKKKIREFNQKIQLLDDIDFLQSKIDFLIKRNKGVNFIKFDSSTLNGDSKVGRNDLSFINDFKDKSLTKGFCVRTQAWIIFEIEREVEFEELEVGSYHGDANWNSSHLNNTIIETSKDNKSWNFVGTIKDVENNLIRKIKINKTVAKFIKIYRKEQGSIGIGYLKIVNLN